MFVIERMIGTCSFPEQGITRWYRCDYVWSVWAGRCNCYCYELVLPWTPRHWFRFPSARFSFHVFPVYIVSVGVYRAASDADVLREDVFDETIIPLYRVRSHRVRLYRVLWYRFRFQTCTVLRVYRTVLNCTIIVLFWGISCRSVWFHIARYCADRGHGVGC